MTERAEKYLKPVSGDQPCGPNLEYDGDFATMERLLKGTPEIEIGDMRRPAEPPSWKELTKQTEKLLGRTRHLHAVIVVSCCWLQQDGLAGFRDGLEVANGLLKGFWEPLYPRLDPDDPESIIERVNRFRPLTAGRGALDGEWLKFADYLHAVPLVHPRDQPPLTYDQVLEARAKGANSSEMTAVQAAVRSADAGEIAELTAVLDDTLRCIDEIDTYLNDQVAALKKTSAEKKIPFSVSAPLFSGLKELLEDFRKVAAMYAVPETAPAPDAIPAAPGAGGAPRAAAGAAATVVAVPGAIQSREDVILLLDRICDYYRETEPGSPVPLLLKRARKVATMSFVETMEEFQLGSASSLRPSLGAGLD